MKLLVLLFPLAIIAQNPCIPRDYGNGGTVCVCNTTYCDTVLRPEKFNDSTRYIIYTSNLAGLRFEKTIGYFQNTKSDSNETVIVNASVTYQSVLGFGGAFTDATGINLDTLPTSAQNLLLQSYYAETGIEYTVGRVPLAGTDFSTRAYSYDDGPIDTSLKNFKLAPEDHQYKIPYIKRAIAYTSRKELALFGSAWTAPKWMKTNHNYTGLGTIIDRYLDSWSNYFVKFLDAYEEYGLRFWGITTGNEPFDALIAHEPLEVVGWPAKYMGHWIRDSLGPILRSSNHSKVKLMILDDQRLFIPWFVQQALNDSKARSYVDGIALHWYYDSKSSPSVITETQEIFPEKFILSTEACSGFSSGDEPVVLGSWVRGENYTYDIIEDMNNFVIGWVDWNLALNPDGGPNYISNYVDSSIIINETSAEFYKQPMFYNLGHFSKFLPPGSVRVQTNGVANVNLVAFRRPDNGIAVVLQNRNDTSVSVNITDGQRGTIELELTPRSVNTVLYW